MKKTANFDEKSLNLMRDIVLRHNRNFSEGMLKPSDLDEAISRAVQSIVNDSTIKEVATLGFVIKRCHIRESDSFVYVTFGIDCDVLA